MGCGKSKQLAVASGNTLLQRKKSSMNSKAGQENGTETLDKYNHVSVGSKVEQKNDDGVKEFGVEDGKGGDESNDVKGKAPEIINVQEDKASEKDVEENKTPVAVVAEEPNENSEDGKVDDSLKNNEKEVNDDVSATAEEKKPAEENKAESEKEDVSLNEEETKDTNQEETLAKEKETKNTNQEETVRKEEETKETNEEKVLAKEEGETKDANVTTSEGEEKDLKVDEKGQ